MNLKEIMGKQFLKALGDNPMEFVGQMVGGDPMDLMKQGIEEYENKFLKDENSRIGFIFTKANDELVLAVCPITEVDNMQVIRKPIVVHKGTEIFKAFMGKNTDHE